MVDDMEIYCDLDRAVFEHMDTVGPGGSVKKHDRHTAMAEATHAAAVQLAPAGPPGYVTCVAPVVHPALAGAHWDQPVVSMMSF